MHTLVTFLGKARDNPATGYRETTYRFPDGTERRTAFFGLALAEHLRPDTLVILGTRGSQWGVLVWHVAGHGDEGARLELIDAEAEARVDQALLDRVAPLLSRATGRPVAARLIPYGRDEAEQRSILDCVAQAVIKGQVSFDLTHGFRHLGMVGFLSAFMLERIGNLDVKALWYGALDMTENGLTPVLRLDGLTAVQRWIEALDRFDATGDYGVFAPLLLADGVPVNKTKCLSAAAFHERVFNLRDAACGLRTFLPVLDKPLPAHPAYSRGSWVSACDGWERTPYTSISAASHMCTLTDATTSAPQSSRGRQLSRVNASNADSIPRISARMAKGVRRRRCSRRGSSNRARAGRSLLIAV